jgi:hypothetical protein
MAAFTINMTSAPPLDHARTLARLQRIAKVMDTAWRIPFTPIRFGADSVLGLIPGAGDLLGLGISGYTLILAHRLGASAPLLAKMAANAAVDFGLGSVPLVGDIFDLFFKSNVRNLKLLIDWMEENERKTS